MLFQGLRFITKGAFLVVLYLNVANAALISSYDFEDGFSDSSNNMGDLLPQNGIIADGQYVFSNNEGLLLQGSFPNSSPYAIEMEITFTSKGAFSSAYSKLFGFVNSDIDDTSGLYLYQNAQTTQNSVLFYPEDSENGNWSIGVPFVVGMAVDADSIDIFLDSVKIHTITDEQNIGFAMEENNGVNFFIGNENFKDESFEGSVDWIRIHDDASTFSKSHKVTEPPLATLFIISLLFGIRQKIRHHRR